MNWINANTAAPDSDELVIFWDTRACTARAGHYIPHKCAGGSCTPARWATIADSTGKGLIIPARAVSHWAPLEAIPGPNEISTEAAVQGVIDNLKEEREKCREWGDRSDEYAVGAEMVIIPGAILAYNHAICLLQQITDSGKEAE